MKDKIKKILIPTDFGELGKFAFTLADLIATESNAMIDVISIVSGPSGAFYSSEGELMNDEGNDYSEWSKKLAAAKASMDLWTKNKIHIANTFCTIGNVDEEILKYASDHNVDLIVMGTEGLFTNKLWSKPSHTEFIANHSSVPVLSLKCDRSNINWKQILLVGDFLEAKELEMEVVKSLQLLFNAELLLLKVKLGDVEASSEQIYSDIEAFARVNGLTNYTKHIYEDENVEAGIGKFAAENNIDLITLGTHQSSGFSKLFGGSISDDVVNHLFHPVLTFPID